MGRGNISGSTRTNTLRNSLQPSAPPCEAETRSESSSIFRTRLVIWTRNSPSVSSPETLLRRPCMASRVRSETLRAPVVAHSRCRAMYSSSESRTLIIRDRGLVIGMNRSLLDWKFGAPYGRGRLSVLQISGTAPLEARTGWLSITADRLRPSLSQGPGTNWRYTSLFHAFRK